MICVRPPVIGRHLNAMSKTTNFLQTLLYAYLKNIKIKSPYLRAIYKNKFLILYASKNSTNFICYNECYYIGLKLFKDMFEKRRIGEC